MRTGGRLRTVRLVSLVSLLITPPPAAAQVVGGSVIEFNSADHTQSVLTGYQALLLSAQADPVSGATLQVGPVVPKGAVATGASVPPAPPVYRIPFAQAGLSVPPCTVAQSACPTYKIVLIAVGQSNSARGVASTSPTFAARSTAGALTRPGAIRVR